MSMIYCKPNNFAGNVFHNYGEASSIFSALNANGSYVTQYTVLNSLFLSLADVVSLQKRGIYLP